MVVGVVYIRNTMNSNALTEICKPLEVVLLFRQRKSRPVVYGAQGAATSFVIEVTVYGNLNMHSV